MHEYHIHGIGIDTEVRGAASVSLGSFLVDYLHPSTTRPLRDDVDRLSDGQDIVVRKLIPHPNLLPYTFFFVASI